MKKVFKTKGTRLGKFVSVCGGVGGCFRALPHNQTHLKNKKRSLKTAKGWEFLVLWIRERG